MLTEGPCLAHYAKGKYNIVTTDASTTGLGITIWQKQDNGNTKPIAYGSRYLNETEKKYSIGELELLAVVWGLEKFRLYLYGKKVHLYMDHQALEPLIKRNRSNKQYSARLTRWLDRLTHFDISIQHIAGSNLKFTDFLSRNPVGGAAPEENYDEEYVTNILAEQADLNLKYGQLFADQSKCSKRTTERTKKNSEHKVEHKTDQSQLNRTFENKSHVNETEQNKKTTSGQSDISTLRDSQTSNTENFDNMDRENFYHWGATREIMDIIRRRNNSLETRRFTSNNVTHYPGPAHRDAGMTTKRRVRFLLHPGRTNAVEKRLPK